MSKKIQKQVEGLLFEIYDNGIQQKECDLASYYEKITQALNIPCAIKAEGDSVCEHKSVLLVRHAAKCKDCGTVFETKW